MQGQNLGEKIFVGTKSYPATPTVVFQYSKSSYSSSELSITFGKKEDHSGLILLSIEMSNCGHSLEWENLSGDILLYLEDGSVIRCLDKGYADKLNCRIQKIYFFTSNEITRLREVNISTIRFTIGGMIHGDGDSYTASSTYPKYKIPIPKGVENEVISIKTKELLNPLFY